MTSYYICHLATKTTQGVENKPLKGVASVCHHSPPFATTPPMRTGDRWQGGKRWQTVATHLNHDGIRT